VNPAISIWFRAQIENTSARIHSQQARNEKEAGDDRPRKRQSSPAFKNS
jgi:hypothetical protein